MWRKWSNGKVGAPPTSQLILQHFRRFTYVTAHSPTLSLLHLRHSSFSNLSFASITSQALHLSHLASRPWFHPIPSITTYLPQIYFSISLYLRLAFLNNSFPQDFPLNLCISGLFHTCYISCSSIAWVKISIYTRLRYNACWSALCNFLHSPTISSLIGSNVFLSNLFSNTRPLLHNHAIQLVI